jgi:hypothetical protein
MLLLMRRWKMEEDEVEQREEEEGEVRPCSRLA